MSDEIMGNNVPADQNVDSATTTEVNPSADQNVDSATTETSNNFTENTENNGSEPSEKKVDVKELIAQRKRRQEAEKEAAYWKGMAEARKEPVTTQTVPIQRTNAEPVEPNSDDFERWEDFEKARTRYTVELAKHELRQEQIQNQHRQQAQTKVSTFEQKLEKFAETDPSIFDIRDDKTLPVSKAMGDIIQESDMAPELLKYLDANRKDAQRIYNMSPLAAAKEMGRLEMQISSAPKPAPPKRVSQAPSPIPTVTPSGSVKEFNPETATMEEYYARRMEQIKPKRR